MMRIIQKDDILNGFGIIFYDDSINFYRWSEEFYGLWTGRLV